MDNTTYSDYIAVLQDMQDKAELLSTTAQNAIEREYQAGRAEGIRQCIRTLQSDLTGVLII